MYTVIQIPAFADWLRAIKDRSVQVRLMKRQQKAQLGNLGDVKSVGNGYSRSYFDREPVGD